jgi:hypothetical protein
MSTAAAPASSDHHPFPACCRNLPCAWLSAGVIEYWSAASYSFPQDEVSFKFKLDTDLYVLAKAKAVAYSMDVSKDGTKFVTMSTDRSACAAAAAAAACAACCTQQPACWASALQGGRGGAGRGGSILHFVALHPAWLSLAVLCGLGLSWAACAWEW